MRKDLRELLDAAEDDLDTVENCMSQVSIAMQLFAQQAVEKYIKVYLLYRINKYPFTHSITKLIEEALIYDKDFEYLLVIKAVSLEDYYTDVRYLPLIVVDEEAKEAIEVAKKVRDFVLRKLGLA